jgi:hypothetical protein
VQVLVDRHEYLAKDHDFYLLSPSLSSAQRQHNGRVILAIPNPSLYNTAV